MDKTKDCIEFVIKNLAEEKDKVIIEKTTTTSAVVYDIHVSENDLTAVLGERGKNARALRALFGSIYGKLGKRLHLQIIDPRAKGGKNS